MANVASKVIKKRFIDKIVSVQQFRSIKGGITSQAVAYACDNDLVDYIIIDDRIKLIVLTEKTDLYAPNKHKNRKVQKTVMSL